MIQMAQDFMDILRKKSVTERFRSRREKEDDIDPSEEEGTTGTQLVEEKKRKEEQEAEEGKKVAEADKERRSATAKTVRMWKEILETFSRTGDVTDSGMRGTMREFVKSYLFPRSTSKQKIDDFYQSLLKQTAPDEILALFFKGYDTMEQDEEGLLSQFRQMSEDTAEYRQEEKEYNGKESLEIIREFFEAAADMPRNLLTGKKMTRGKLNKLVEMLRDSERIDVDELGEDTNMLLRQFRELLLTLDRIKDEQENILNKSLDEEDKNWQLAVREAVADDEFPIFGTTEEIEDTLEGKEIYDEQLDAFDSYRKITGQIPALIDKIEEILEHVVNLRNNAVEDNKVNELEKTKKQMKQLVKVTVGNYEFDLGKGKKRAIKIN
tara:strand:- start:8742 stop:9881 length:1140 start_codon:yes stop_codon:yes gene_type:complete